MSQNSKIEWCDHTFNPWIGCTKVSPACDHCYAERSTPARTLGVLWGSHAERRRTGAANWALPKRWNAAPYYECTCCGWRGDANHPEFKTPSKGCIHDLVPARARVFCASLADVFDNQVPPEWRDNLFEVIRTTPNLDWQLLTKRPQNIVRMVEDSGAVAGNGTRYLPENVWLGTTAEDQKRADHNVIHLLRAKKSLGAKVAFLSVEPLLEPIRLWMLKALDYEEDIEGAEVYPLKGLYAVPDCDWDGPKLDWVIVGGESGPQARPMHPDWVRRLRDQCVEAGVPFLFKQWGEWTPGENVERHTGTVDGAWWVDGRWMPSRENLACDDGHRDDEPDLYRIGKKAAGRLLDGREWNEVPS